MKTSIFIPVDDTKLDNLVEIVKRYNDGSVIPDEIVINALGITDQASLDILRQVQDLKQENVIIFACKTEGTVSENKNYTLKLTTGDIVMYHNPYSFPSMKRVEVIKKYFEENDKYMVIHTNFNLDVFASDVIPLDNLREIHSQDLYRRYFPFNVRENAWQYTRTFGQELGVRYLDYDSLCIRREVMNEIKWKNQYELEIYRGSADGSGYEFCIDTLYKYNRTDILNIPLTISKN